MTDSGPGTAPTVALSSVGFAGVLKDWIFPIFLTGLLYYWGALLGQRLVYPGTNVAFVWPPVGVSIGMMLVFGYRVWPAILVANLFTVLPSALQLHPGAAGFVTFAGETLADVFQALLAVALLRRMKKPDHFLDHPASVLIFVVVLIFSQCIGASIAVLSIMAPGVIDFSKFFPVWNLFWISNTVSCLILVPFILFWSRWKSRPNIRRTLATALAAVITIAVTFVVFRYGTFKSEHYFLYFTVFVILFSLFIAGSKASTLSMLIISGLAIGATMSGFGPFARLSPGESAFLLELYTGTLALTGLIIAAVRKQWKIAVERMREKDELFSLFLENSPVYVFFKDENIRAVELSRNYEKMLNKPLSEILGKNMFDLFPSELARSMVEDDRRILREGKRVEVQEELGGRHYTTIKFPILRDGKPRMLAGFTIDITDRVSAQEQLREKTAELDRFFENTLDLFCIADTDGYFRRLNPQWQETLGYRLEDLVGKRFLDFVHPDDLQSTLDAVKKLGSGKKIVSFENRYRCANGSYRWIEWRSTPFGEKLIYASARDVTERRRVEEALRESEHWLLESQRVSRVGSYVLDVTTGAWSCSETLDEIFGAGPDFVKNIESWTAILHPEHREMMTAYFTEEVIGKGHEFNREYMIQRFSDHETRWVLGRGALFFNNAGKPEKMAGTIQDITDRKMAEIEVEKLNTNLQAQVQEEIAKNRDHELMLLQQSRLAALGEMIGNIAHQWRQPLNAISLIIQNLGFAWKTGKIDAGYVENAVEKSLQVVDHMSKTIDDFRNFFKPDKEKTLFLLETEISNVVSLVEASFRNHFIEIQVDIEKNCRVNGFPNEFGQVLLNLLNNAREALINRNVLNPLVQISVKILETGCRVTVTDNAGGIPEDIIDRIFDPYFTTKDQGTGIGLYMSRMIIERNMGGKLYARNRGTGAEFVIEI